MKTPPPFLVVLAVLSAACAESPAEPLPHDGLQLPGPPSPSAAAVALESIEVSYQALATGSDLGPQDGFFDAITQFNLGSVVNNGWTSYRTAFSFDLSSIPEAASIESATVRVSLNNWEGSRTVAVHGFPGDGTLDLADLSKEGLLGTAQVQPTGTQMVSADAMALIQRIRDAGGGSVELTLREEPANTANYLVMFMNLGFYPRLVVRFRRTLSIQIDIRPGSAQNVIPARMNGSIPVALLSSATFDAVGLIDVSSLTFGRSGSETSLRSCSPTGEDVNGDGLLDRICHFDAQSAGLQPGDTSARLEGKLLDGSLLSGSDAVRVIG